MPTPHLLIRGLGLENWGGSGWRYSGYKVSHEVGPLVRY